MKRTVLHCLPAIVSSNLRTLPRLRPVAGPAYTAVLAADLHTDADPWRDRTDVLRRALSGIRKRLGRIDALVLAGDITNCGDEKEYRLLDRLLRRYVRAEAILPALGNHDAWHHSDHPNYEIAYRLFRDLCVRCGHRGDENYYEYADRCCIYLILGTERTMHNGTYLSNAQLDWLETRLRLAVRRDRVTVVVNHQATAGRNGGEASWEEEGQLAVSDRLEKLLTEAAAEAKHPVFFVSGHKHMLSPACVEKAEGKLTFVNLPSLEYGGGDEHAGTAALLQFRPEDDAPYLSFYDFIRGEPVPDTELSR